MTVNVIYCDDRRPSVPRGLRSAARSRMRGHDGPIQLTREHGQWWACCNACGLTCSHEPDGDLTDLESGDGSCRAA